MVGDFLFSTELSLRNFSWNMGLSSIWGKTSRGLQKRRFYVFRRDIREENMRQAQSACVFSLRFPCVYFTLTSRLPPLTWKTREMKNDAFTVGYSAWGDQTRAVVGICLKITCCFSIRWATRGFECKMGSNKSNDGLSMAGCHRSKLPTFLRYCWGRDRKRFLISNQKSLPFS